MKKFKEIKEKGFLKITSRKRPDLTKYFDSVDLGIDAIGDWEEFERKFYEIHWRKHGRSSIAFYGEKTVIS